MQISKISASQNFGMPFRPDVLKNNSYMMRQISKLKGQEQIDAKGLVDSLQKNSDGYEIVVGKKGIFSSVPYATIKSSDGIETVKCEPSSKHKMIEILLRVDSAIDELNHEKRLGAILNAARKNGFAMWVD